MAMRENYPAPAGLIERRVRDAFRQQSGSPIRLGFTVQITSEVNEIWRLLKME
jgi:hypothetical protein